VWSRADPDVLQERKISGLCQESKHDYLFAIASERHGLNYKCRNNI